MKSIFSIEERIETETSGHKEKLDSFETELTSRLAQMDSTLLSSSRDIAAECDARQTKYLTELDRTLSEYKKEMEYRFKKLNSAGADVDKLESALRKLMDQSQKKVVGDFEKFTQQQIKNQHAFEEDLSTRFAKVKDELSTVQTSLDEIKKDSAARLSSKVKVFEDSFIKDITKREEDVTSKLASWKNTFDAQFEVFTSEYEEKRTTLERQYEEGLSKRILELQKKTQEQEKKFQTALLAGQNTIQEQINSVNQKIHDFIEQYRAEIKKAIEGVDGELKAESDEYKTRMTENLERTEKELNSKIEEFKGILSSKQETQSATIDASVQEFAQWKSRLQGQYDDYYQQIDEQLKTLAETNEQKIGELQKDFSEAAKRAGDVLSTFDDDSKKHIDEFETMYNTFYNQVKGYTEEQIKNAELKIKDLKKNFTEKATEYKQAYQGATDRLNDETNNLQMKVDDIKKSIAQFISESSVFDKADILKSQLKDSVEDLEKKIASVKNYDAKINDLNTQIRQLEHLSDDVNQKLNAYSADKSRLDSIEYKFDTLLNLSNGMDSKITEIQKLNDDFVNIQADVRKYTESMAAIENKFDRIEKKSDTVDRVAEAVDNSFKNISALEDRLSNYSNELEEIPAKMEKLKKDMDNILKNGETISDAVDKVNSLKDIMRDVDEHISEIKESKDGIVATEKRLQKLYSDGEKQLDLLHSVTAKATGTKKSKSNSELSPKLKSNIVSLKAKGWTNSEIAKSLNIEENIVQLILEVGTDE